MNTIEMNLLKTNIESGFVLAVKLPGFAVMLIGMVALAGWIFGFPILASFSPDYIPMATSTAISAMVFGFVLLSDAYNPSDRYRKWFVTVIIGIVSLFGFLELPGYIIPAKSAIETLLFPSNGIQNNIQVNLMSPYTGLLFLLSGIALEINIHFARRKSVTNVISALGITVTFAGFAAVLGYSFGTPLRFGGSIIPLSMPTSIVFLLLGIALICIAGPKGIVLRHFSGNSTNALVLRAVLPVVLSAIILGDLLGIILTSGLQINPALVLATLTIIVSIVTTFVLIRLTKNIFLNVNMAERELIQQKVKFQQLFENSPMGIAMLDEHEKILAINKQFVTIFRFTHDEIRGRSIVETIVPDTLTAEKNALSKSGPGELIEKETIRMRKDGSLVPVYVFEIPIIFEDKLIGIYNMYLDIANLKQAETKLKEKIEELARMATVVSDSNDAVIMHDFDGKILAWNRGAKETYGYTEGEALGKNIREIVAEPDREAALNLIQRIRQGDIIKSFELRRVAKDDRVLDVWLTTTLLTDENGNPTAIATTERDITGRKLAEEEIKKINAELEQRVYERTLQLETINKELETFSYSVSHDLRAPLRSIDGFSNLLLKNYSDLLDEQGKDYFQRVMQASRKMGLLIDDLLKLSRFTRVEMKREITDLSSLAESIAEELRVSNPERIANFVIQPGMIDNADNDLIQIALQNMISNAWKYCKYKPETKIEFGTIEKEGKKVYFIRDNGVGFDMKYVDKLFGAFQRLHSITEFEGTGIGLATVSRIIRRHGGTIWAEGVVDSGATFYFTL